MDIWVVGQQMMMLFAMMLVGYFLAKIHWIDGTLSSALSRLVVNVFNPFLILSSVFGESISETGTVFWQNLFLVGIFYVALFVVGLLLVLILRPGRAASPIYRLMTLLPNCGFMGIPVVSALLGREYVIYVSIYMLVYNVILYTYGIHLVRKSAAGLVPDGQRGGDSLREKFRKIFCNVGIVASLLALVVFFLGIPVPGNIKRLCEYMGNPCVPLSMMLIGCSIAYASLGNMLKGLRIYGFLLIRMLLVPMAGAFLVHFLPLDDVISKLFIIMLAMPAGSMVVLVAEEYKGDADTASAGVVLSTLLSIVTIPVVCLFM